MSLLIVVHMAVCTPLERTESEGKFGGIWLTTPLRFHTFSKSYVVFNEWKGFLAVGRFILKVD